MSNDHPAEEDLVMFYYRENRMLEGGSPDKLPAHLDVCPSCKAAYGHLMRVLEACDDVPVPEPHPAFESRMWNRLEPQLHPLNATARLSAVLARWSPFSSRWAAMTAVAAMLIAAFLAGRFTRPTATVLPGRIVAMTADGRQRVLLMSLGDHLERSEMVLTELANGPDGSSDLALERERARTLVSENRLFRQTASQTSDPAMAQVLDELERVLLDISHGTDPGEIKSRIDSESLLFKLRVLGSTLNRTNSSAQKAPQETL